MSASLRREKREIAARAKMLKFEGETEQVRRLAEDVLTLLGRVDEAEAKVDGLEGLATDWEERGINGDAMRAEGARCIRDALANPGYWKTDMCEPTCAPHLVQFCSPECEDDWNRRHPEDAA